MLKSHRMQLSPQEKSWLPWLGKTGKLAMGWACHVNRHRYSILEQTFEGIAANRVRILQGWAEQQWAHLQSLGDDIAHHFSNRSVVQDNIDRARFQDFSELFVVDSIGKVIASSCTKRIGQSDLDRRALQQGLKQPFLHGPYVDQNTLEIGPSSSRFHDAVTLMFYLPLTLRGKTLGCLCGRVPNDVIGDLIQREAGHIYHESGDNYLFMVKPVFDPGIRQGTALSRSRFEDSTFSHGDNLKDGLQTEYGMVKVRNHTELELMFTDPATHDLHPGVRETIRHGENLFVTYPGYSDYRHIPVVGKGTTFRLPGSLDTWGMMCEADLEEVYRFRSVNFRMMRIYLMVVFTTWLISMIVGHGLSLGMLQTELINLSMLGVGAALFYRFGTRPVVTRVRDMGRMIRSIAEGGGNLAQRVPREQNIVDEPAMVAQWVNSFIDNLDGTVGRVINGIDDMDSIQEQMAARSQEAAHATNQVLAAMQEITTSLQKQLADIDIANQTASEIRQAMHTAVEQAKTQFEVVSSRTQGIRTSINESSRTIRTLSDSTAQIGQIVSVINEIADQTNLLALNAAIEAARAGESGRGFSVVADEVRKLAERTAKATHEISHMITTVQGQARNAVFTMESGIENMEEGLRLAEVAAADKSGMQNIMERMFTIIQDISHGAMSHGENVKGVAQVTESMRNALNELDFSATQARQTASRMKGLADQFQVSQSQAA
ncbi:MAG: methyl-accepting chemotaxis protein [Sideroxydans sp.]|nr:methyl-accepting chemotaxis protein [Sideroxydans sp.]